MQHVVKSGDTLFLIAKRYYGNGAYYPLIAGANGITNVNLIRVGQVLTIPGTEKYGTLAPGEAPMIAPSGIVPKVEPSPVQPQPNQPAAPSENNTMKYVMILGVLALVAFVAFSYIGGSGEEETESTEPQEA